MRIKEIILEGGNVDLGDKGRAEKLDLTKFNRKDITIAYIKLFTVLNNQFHIFTSKHNKIQNKNEMIEYPEGGEDLWPDFRYVTSGKIFTGSSEAFFDSTIDDDTFKKHKSKVGDLDLVIPEKNMAALWYMLSKIEGKQITPDFVYIGNNKDNPQALGGQINALFRYTDGNGSVVLQVDFEEAEFDGNAPSDWALFSHSSHWDDISQGIKGLFHKYLLSSITKSASKVPNGILVTKTSTPEKITISKKGGEPQTNLGGQAFSVVRGLRDKLQPLNVKIDPKTGKPSDTGMMAYKELDSKTSNYITKPTNIFEKIFGHTPSEQEITQFKSYVGLLQLLRDNVEKHQYLADILENFIIKLWGISHTKLVSSNEPSDVKTTPGGGQAIEARPDLWQMDKDAKCSALNKFFNTFPELKFAEEVYQKYLYLYYGDNGEAYAEFRTSGVDTITESIMREAKDMLDISIKPVEKVVSDKNGLNEVKIRQFLNDEYVVEEKFDGTKLTLFRNEEKFDPSDYTKNWVISYKNTIIYPNEFKHTNDEDIRQKSIGISQYKLFLNHIERIHKNTREIPRNTEFFIEFIQRKPTVVSKYKNYHNFYLVAYSPSKAEIHGNRLITHPSDFLQDMNDRYAAILDISSIPVLFKGRLGSYREIKEGIVNQNLQQTFNRLILENPGNDTISLWKFVKKLFVEFESTLGNKPEGVILKSNKGLFKIQREDQLDKELRKSIKGEFRSTQEEESEYYDKINRVSDDLYDVINSKGGEPKDKLGYLSKIYTMDIPITHSKKDSHKIKDDIYQILRQRILSELPENNNALFLGKLSIMTKAHYDIIENELMHFNKLVVVLISGKDNPIPSELRKKLLKECFPSIEVIESTNGYIPTILNKVSWNITTVICGEDRADGYKQQLAEKNIKIAVKMIPRNMESKENVSATNVFRAIAEDDIDTFKRNTPTAIHKFFGDLKPYAVDYVKWRDDNKGR